MLIILFDLVLKMPPIVIVREIWLDFYSWLEAVSGFITKLHKISPGPLPFLHVPILTEVINIEPYRMQV